MNSKYEALREAVARAICSAQGTDPDAVLTGTDPDEGGAMAWVAWLEYLPEADAALRVVRKALREPSDGMNAAGACAYYGTNRDHAAAIWDAMILKSALGGGDE